MSSWTVWAYSDLGTLGSLDTTRSAWFLSVVMDAMELLNGFVQQVVIARRGAWLLSWASWLREDLGSGTYAWLRRDFVSLPFFLVVKHHVAQTSRILVEPHLIDAECRKAWMPFFCRAGHPEVTVTQFLAFVDSFLPQEAEIDLPPISGRELMEVVRAKKSTAGGLDSWAWKDI